MNGIKAKEVSDLLYYGMNEVTKHELLNAIYIRLKEGDNLVEPVIKP